MSNTEGKYELEVADAERIAEIVMTRTFDVAVRAGLRCLHETGADCALAARPRGLVDAGFA